MTPGCTNGYPVVNTPCRFVGREKGRLRAALLLAWIVHHANIRTNVFIDGFNFYDGCLDSTPYRWFDFDAFCRASLPSDSINRIRYFTARVKPTPRDPMKPRRQDIYLRALTTFSSITIHEGRFLEGKKRGRLVVPIAGQPDVVEVFMREEKGSDVNIASYRLLDAFDGDYEQAVILSNDSDLVEPIRIVHLRFQLDVHILSPNRHHSYALAGAATSYGQIDRSLLASCQLPSPLVDARGRTLTKPVRW